MSRLRPKTTSPTRVPLYVRAKGKVEERKENTYMGAKSDAEHKRIPPVLAQRSGHELLNVNVKYVKKSEPAKVPSRTRYLADNEPKPKTLATKRRNVLAIRKPNAGKPPAGVTKTKSSRRSADDSESPRASLSAKLSKRSFSRRPAARRAAASSSSDDMLGGNWEEVAGGTVLGSQPAPEPLAGKRRPFPNPSPSHLKKIRLKTGL